MTSWNHELPSNLPIKRIMEIEALRYQAAERRRKAIRHDYRIFMRDDFQKFFISCHGGEGTFEAFERLTGMCPDARCSNSCAKPVRLLDIEKSWGPVGTQVIDLVGGSVFIYTASHVVSINNYDGQESLRATPRNPGFFVQ
jgi:hypothetical protein